MSVNYYLVVISSWGTKHATCVQLHLVCSLRLLANNANWFVCLFLLLSNSILISRQIPACRSIIHSLCCDPDDNIDQSTSHELTRSHEYFRSSVSQAQHSIVVVVDSVSHVTLNLTLLCCERRVKWIDGMDGWDGQQWLNQVQCPLKSFTR